VAATTLAYAVVRGDPPAVYAADDVDTLHHVLALQVVAATPGATIAPSRRERIREALVEERWGDAVVGWIEVTGIPVRAEFFALQPPPPMIISGEAAPASSSRTAASSAAAGAGSEGR